MAALTSLHDESLFQQYRSPMPSGSSVNSSLSSGDQSGSTETDTTIDKASTDVTWRSNETPTPRQSLSETPMSGRGVDSNAMHESSSSAAGHVSPDRDTVDLTSERSNRSDRHDRDDCQSTSVWRTDPDRIVGSGAHARNARGYVTPFSQRFKITDVIAHIEKFSVRSNRFGNKQSAIEWLRSFKVKIPVHPINSSEYGLVIAQLMEEPEYNEWCVTNLTGLPWAELVEKIQQTVRWG